MRRGDRRVGSEVSAEDKEIILNDKRVKTLWSQVTVLAKDESKLEYTQD